MIKSQTLRTVAAALLEAGPHARIWGYGLSRQTGVRSGILYPMLNRMMENGWLSDSWEDPALTGGRPARRYYTVTDLGRDEMSRLQ